jgi:hypothetical protein
LGKRNRKDAPDAPSIVLGSRFAGPGSRTAGFNIPAKCAGTTAIITACGRPSKGCYLKKILAKSRFWKSGGIITETSVYR